MEMPGTLLLEQSEVRELLSFAECVDVVEEAFRLHGKNKSMKPQLMHVDSGSGEFHVKAGGLEFERRYFALKANGSFFHNSVRHGLPNIQGIILLSDGETGYPLAIMDSREITMKRTGAATAVAAKYLAKKSSDTVVICGSGLQARIQLVGLASGFALRQAFIFSRNTAKAEALASQVSAELGIRVSATDDLNAALRVSQICVTCTPAHHFYVRQEDVVPGLFIAAVGADSPGKQEIDPCLLRSHKVVSRPARTKHPRWRSAARNCPGDAQRRTSTLSCRTLCWAKSRDGLRTRRSSSSTPLAQRCKIRPPQWQFIKRPSAKAKDRDSIFSPRPLTVRPSASVNAPSSQRYCPLPQVQEGQKPRSTWPRRKCCQPAFALTRLRATAVISP